MNGESTRNRLYPDEATALARLASLPVMDGSTPVYLSPTKKLISMCGTSFNCAPIFVIFDGILKVAEGNAAMYDGSSTQWNNYSIAKIRAAGATEAQAATWAFDAVTGGTSSPRAVGTLPAAVPGENAVHPRQLRLLAVAERGEPDRDRGQGLHRQDERRQHARRRWRRIHRRRLLRLGDTTMTKNSFRTGLLLTLALALLALPALAQEKETMTAPPWGDAGAKIHFGDEDQGTLQVQYKGQFRLSYRDIGSGPDGTDGTTNFGFRRNRLAFMGAWSDKVSLYVQMEFADPNLAPVDFSGAGFNSNAQLLDAAVRFSFSDAFKLNVGRFKYNFSRENLESCEDPLTLDRSLFIRTAYVGTRDDGVALWGNLFGDRFQYRVDAMEGRQAAAGHRRAVLRAPATAPAAT